jgi:hypothetical protein
MARFLAVVIAAGAAVSLLGGVGLAALWAADPAAPIVRLAAGAYLAVVFGFLAMSAMAVAGAAVTVLLRPAGPTAPVPAKAAKPASAEPDLKTAFEQMKTYVDLEMWELALDKAAYILRKFPGTNEAELVSKSLPELRWKAEPKYVGGSAASLSRGEERALQEKGLAEMLRHVRTYCDLDMWDLAKQKALAIIKSFPDSREAAELARMFPEIERRAAQKAAAPPPPEPAPARPEAWQSLAETPAPSEKSG